MSTFTDWADVVRTRPWVGSAHLRLSELRCWHGGHDRQGNEGGRSRHAFLKADRLAKDVAQVNDAARGGFLSVVGMALGADAQLRPVQGADALPHRGSDEEVRQDLWRDRQSYGSVTGDRTMDDIQKRRADRWNFLFIAGMWFQDLFNYDFRRTRCASSPTARSRARFPSAPTTPASAGGTSSRRCT